MKHKDCIFVCEDDCPLDTVGFSCEDCEQNSLTVTIKQAVDDYVALGESFEQVLKLLKTLIANDGKTVAISTPVAATHIINRVITALLGTTPLMDKDKIVYRRLIFYFFKILIAEFEEEEYTEPEELH